LVSFAVEEGFPFFLFMSDFYGAHDFGYAVDYAFVAAVSTDHVAAVVDADVAGFVVIAEALNFLSRFG
jgi:hypothetical protein